MRPRLQLKPKNKLRVRTSVKLAVAAAGVAALLTTGFFLYNYFGRPTDSIASEDSYVAGFAYRKKVTATNLAKGNEVLLNFPLLVHLEDPQLRNIKSGGTVVHPKGYDIRFTKKDGTSLYLSSIDTYNPATGKLSAWLLIDSLIPGRPAEFYMYYSNAAVRSELPAVLFTDQYKGVWHFNTKAQCASDRTLNVVSAGAEEAQGKIGIGYAFEASAEGGLSVENWSRRETQGSFSISAWVKFSKLGEQTILSTQGDAPGGYRMFLTQHGTLGSDIITVSGQRAGVNSAEGEKLQKDRWYYLASVYDKTSGKIQTYVDGIQDASYTLGELPGNYSAPLQIGRNQFAPSQYFSGTIDEVRLAAHTFSQAWLATEFYNQLMPDNTFILGPAEALRMSVAESRKNKAAYAADSEAARAAVEAAGPTRAQKSPSGTNPVPATQNLEEIQARLENIRRANNER